MSYTYDPTLFSMIETPTGKLLYPYQSEQVRKVIGKLREYQSTLCISPTGTGKSFVMAQVGYEFAKTGKVMYITDQINLLDQLASEIHEVIGRWPSVERGEFRISEREYDKADYAISTVQSLISGDDISKRYMKFNPFDYSLVVIDEAHCYANKSGIEVAKWFMSNPNCKVVGFTATPDRSDRVSLKCIFHSVAYHGKVKDYIDNGWLVRPHVTLIRLDNYDISNVGLSGGDISLKQLSEAIGKEEIIAAMADEIVKYSGDMKTLIFCPGVTFAEMLRDYLNKLKTPGCAACIFGHTNKDERKDVDKSFKQGDLQYFVNVGVAVKGWNFRGLQCIFDCTVTISRSKHEQKLGRLFRTLAGVLDGLEDATPDERLAAIAASDKPIGRVFEFYGNSGRNKLVSTVDILAGDDYSDKAIQMATEMLKEDPELEIEEALEEAEKEVKRNRQQQVSELCDLLAEGKLSLTVKATYGTIDPFSLWDLPQADYVNEAIRGHLPTKEQITILKKYHIDATGLTFEQAKVAVAEAIKLSLVPTPKQMDKIRKMQIPVELHKKLTKKMCGRLLKLWIDHSFRPYETWKQKAGLE